MIIITFLLDKNYYSNSKACLAKSCTHSADCDGLIEKDFPLISIINGNLINSKIIEQKVESYQYYF